MHSQLKLYFQGKKKKTFSSSHISVYVCSEKNPNKNSPLMIAVKHILCISIHQIFETQRTQKCLVTCVKGRNAAF